MRHPTITLSKTPQTDKKLIILPFILLTEIFLGMAVYLIQLLNSNHSATSLSTNNTLVIMFGFLTGTTTFLLINNTPFSPIKEMYSKYPTTKAVINAILIISAILTLLYLSLELLGTNIFQPTIDSSLGLILSITLIYLTTITIAVMGYQKGKKQYQQQQMDLKDANQQILQSLTGIDNIDISKGIQLQLNEQEGYYIFAKRQAVVSSIISITIIIAGVLLGMVCIATAFFLKSNIPLAYITGALSAITELIGGLVFVFNTQASKKMDKYFDSLDTLRNTMLSVQLLDKYSDEQERQKKLGKIIDSLIEGKTNPHSAVSI